MKLQVKSTKKITAIFAALLIIFISLICLTSSGCSFSINYDYIKYDGEEGYYVVRGSGQPYSLKGTLEIPETYGSGDKLAPVREIDREAFRGCSITKVIIPASITKIGVAAFANCSQLEEVEFKEGSSLKEIPQGTFGFDVSLTQITFPDSVENIGYCSFLGCKSLKTVNLSKNIKSITASAFEDCYDLSEITFPEGLESIGYLAFYNCALTEVVIPDSVHDKQIPVTDTEGNPVNDKDGNPQMQTVYGLDYGAFHTCRALKKAVIGNGLTLIRAGVFGFCDSLEEVYIPSSVTKIEGTYFKNGNYLSGHAFHNCKSLKTVNYAGTQEEWAQIKIDSTEYSSNGSTFNNNALFKDKNDKLTINYNKSYAQ